MVDPFIYTGLPVRVRFGPGRVREVAEEVRSLGCSRALVLSTPEQRSAAEQISAHLGELAVGIAAEAFMHTPVAVTEKALTYLREQSCDCLVAIGGGSTIGLGKALALRTDLPQIAIPTTYAGSEVTPILGETKEGCMRARRIRSLP
jgi:maleylacetate reductase